MIENSSRTVSSIQSPTLDSAIIPNLEWSGVRLRFRCEPQLEYRLELQEGATWRPFGAWSRFVDGAFFALEPQTFTRDSDGLRFAGATAYTAVNADTPHEYTWTLTVALSESGWFEVDLELHLPEVARFNTGPGFEPEVMVQLGALPPYDRGHSFWARTELAGYTRFDGTPNNDFPALYYRDPSSRARVIVYLELSDMTWMGAQTMCRFRDYRLGLREFGGLERGYALGLFGIALSGQVWPAGASRVRYALHLHAEERQTNDRQALGDLVQTCGARINGVPDMRYGRTWRELALGAAADLNDDACWSRTPHGEWLRPYVNDHSPAWEAVGRWEGKSGNENLGQTPYMLWFQETVLGALLATTGSDLETGNLETGALERIRQRVLSSTLNYYSSVESVFDGYLSSNMTDGAVSGTWQYVHSLMNYWWIGRLLERDEIQDKALKEVRDRALPLLRKHAFIPPTTYHRRSLERVGPSVSYSVLGLYADFFARLARADPRDATWQDLALTCIRTLSRAPEYAIHQESNHIVHAIVAGSQLLASLEPAEAALLRADLDYLRHQSLRQFYWFEENTPLGNHPDVRVRGLSSCCTPMSYTAFWENIMQAQLHAAAMDVLEPDALTLRFLNLTREHAKSAIPSVLGMDSTHAFIPLEDVRLVETAKDPPVGQEVYGTGHVFWAYLLFEAHLKLEDNPLDVLALCTNLHELPAELARARRFLVFNASLEPRTVKASFQVAGLTRARTLGHSDGVIVHHLEPSSLSATLPAQGWLRLELSDGDAQ